MTLYRGDDTNAFNCKFLTINLMNANGLSISKAEFRCGAIIKTFENPTFPISVSLNSEETQKLWVTNTCSLAIYDELGRKKTCEGTITIPTRAKAV